MASAVAYIREANGRVYAVRAEASNVQEAEDLLKTRAAIAAGVLVSASLTSDLDGVTTAGAVASGDAVMVVTVGGKRRSVKLEQLPNSYGNGTTGDFVTPLPPALQNYLTDRGMTFVSGRFTK